MGIGFWESFQLFFIWFKWTTILWKSYEHITRLDLNFIANADSFNSGGITCVLSYKISGLVYVSLVGILFSHSENPPYWLNRYFIKVASFKATATLIFHGLQEWQFSWEEPHWLFISILSQWCWGCRRLQRENHSFDTHLESLKGSNNLFINSSCWYNSYIKWYGDI